MLIKGCPPWLGSVTASVNLSLNSSLNLSLNPSLKICFDEADSTKPPTVFDKLKIIVL